MAQYDLTNVLAKSLDRHLMFPLLEWLSSRQIFSETDIQKAKIDLLQKTNMVDYAMDVYMQHYNRAEPPSDMVERRAEVVARLKSLQAQADSIVTFLSNENLVKQLKQDKAYNLALLRDQYDIGPDQIDALYNYAKFQFDCGNYSEAAEFLYHYRTLTTNSERNMSALWGKMAAEILKEDWGAALDDLTKLKEAIDANTFAPPLRQLQQRTWLLHWSLFIFFNDENGRNAIIDLFFQDRYLHTIQATSQHLLRYLAAAVIVNKRRRNVMKDLIKVIEQEAYEYSDPITEFLEKLFVSFDFDGAQQKLKECEETIDNDYFLASLKDDFVENARLFIFETYCRIHQCIDLRMLSGKLNLDEEAAERWIVNLIRHAGLDAKIDSKARTVVMGAEFPTPYDDLMSTAKDLSGRAFLMANAVVGTQRA